MCLGGFFRAMCVDFRIVFDDRKLANSLLVDVGGERRMRYKLSIGREDSLGKYWENVRAGIKRNSIQGEH